MENKQSEPKEDFATRLIKWYLREKEKEKKALTGIRANSDDNNVNRP